MMDRDDKAPRTPISLLDYLEQRGWKKLRDNGGDEVLGLCPLHLESIPSFYVNRRKQAFYCHGCDRAADWPGSLICSKGGRNRPKGSAHQSS